VLKSKEVKEKKSKEKNVLVVTWTAFPPTSGSGVVVSNLLSQFNPTKVVLAGEHTFGADIVKHDKPDYPFYLLKHPFHTGFKGSKYFKWLALRKVLRQLEQIIEKHQIEVVFGIFPDEFYTYAACRLAQRKKLPFYSWLHNTYLDNRTGILKMIASTIQPRIFNYSKRIFTMSQGMNDYYQEHYPEYKDKFVPLLHGFYTPDEAPAINTQINDPVKFMMTGNINHSNRDATERLAKAVLRQSPKNELHIFGGTPKSVWDNMGIIGRQVYLHGFVPQLQQLVDSFDQYDIMLLPHGFEGNLSEAEYLTIFPTRTIPLLYSGKPILAHVPADTAISIMLKNKSCAFLVTKKDDDILGSAIEQMIDSENLRDDLVRNALIAAKDYDVRNIVLSLKNILFN
jgi:glycosyltransferase involved in cell wall biosynthesis